MKEGREVLGFQSIVRTLAVHNKSMVPELRDNLAEVEQDNKIQEFERPEPLIALELAVRDWQIFPVLSSNKSRS